MGREQYSPGNYESANHKGQEVLLSEFESVFPELAYELIRELGLENTAGDVTLVLHPNGTASVKRER